MGGRRYVRTVVDEAADMYCVKLLRRKTNTLHGMREISAEIKRDSGRGVVQWTRDRGSEFTDKGVQSFIRDELSAEIFYSNVESPVRG